MIGSEGDGSRAAPVPDPVRYGRDIRPLLSDSCFICHGPDTAARKGELRVQQCAETGRLIFPPRAMSPWAPHSEPVWTSVSGFGTVWSFAVPHPPLLPQFAELAPYNVIVVALDEDPTVRMVGNLVRSEGGATPG